MWSRQVTSGAGREPPGPGVVVHFEVFASETVGLRGQSVPLPVRVAASAATGFGVQSARHPSPICRLSWGSQVSSESDHIAAVLDAVRQNAPGAANEPLALLDESGSVVTCPRGTSS